MFDRNILAKNIKKYRTLKGISQNQMAKALYISPQAVSKWESGVTTPDIENLYNIAKLLEITLDSLLSSALVQKVMICADGGGSKTEFLLFCQDGEIKNRLVLGGSNPNIVGVNEAYAVFKKGIDTLANNYYEILGIYIGGAGMLSGKNGETILKKLKKDYPAIPIDVKTDICNVIASATAEENCTALICGTGSVVYASSANGLKRFGGWGCRLDTLGSGYDIGREVLRTALGEKDGIGEKSIITQLTEKRLGMGVWEAIGDIYEKGDSYIASFAPIAFEAYSLGDKVAKEILMENAKRLATLVAKADCGKTVIASGSVIAKNTVYAQMIKNNLPKNKNFVIPTLPQIYGAGKLCLKLCGVDSKAFDEKFEKQYKKLAGEE